MEIIAESIFNGICMVCIAGVVAVFIFKLLD